MRTKKLLLIVGGVAAGLLLAAALVVGGVLGAILYTVSNSEAAETARAFLRRNERLRHDIGDVRGFGRFVTGSINAAGGEGAATLNLKVEGARRTVNASVDLMYGRGGDWRVVGANYRDEAGRTVELLDKYGPPEGDGETGPRGDAETEEGPTAETERRAPTNRDATTGGGSDAGPETDGAGRGDKR